MPRRNPSRSAYVVRFKSGDKFRAHQFDDARNHDHAANRINGGERVLSVRKMSPDDIIESDFKSMSLRLRDIVGVGGFGRRPDAILDDMTLDSIVFPNMVSRRNKKKASTFARRQRQIKENEKLHFEKF